MAESGVYIKNLSQFRRALKLAEDATPRELSAAIKEAGQPVAARAAAVAPRRSGGLASGYRVRAAGTKGSVINKVPYAAGAEWGLRGKWKGFTKYPAFGTGASLGRGRFAWRAVVENRQNIIDTMERHMEDIKRIHGWAN